MTKAEARLDRLEGSLELTLGQGEVVLMFDEEIGMDDKVHRTLRDHYDFWKESGASDFACSVIRNGYIPEFISDPGCYSEPNNKSFSAHAQWGMEAVAKLVKAKIVRKVRREDLTCVNPLSVAVNKKLKKRLCIDLSRCYNKVSRARKFKIESTREALQIIEKRRLYVFLRFKIGLSDDTSSQGICEVSRLFGDGE